MSSGAKFNQASNYARIAILIGIASFALFIIWKNTLEDPTVIKWNIWAFYEWLINYEGGFVRRGLAGALVSSYFYGNEITAINFIVFVLSFNLIILATTFAITTVNTTKSALLYAFCPTGIYWMAASNEYFYRKEILFYISLLLVSLIFNRWLKESTKFLSNFLTVVIFLVSIFLSFVHEAFLFYGCLLFSLILLLVHKRHPAKAKVIVQTYLAMSLLIFIFFCVFKGDASTSKAIWESLSEPARSLSHNQDVAGGISAIGWSLKQGLSMSLYTIQSGLGAYYLFSILIIYLTLGFIVSEQRNLSLQEFYVSKKLFIPFLCILLTFLPLFILGWDWGRWVMGIWYVSVCMFFLRIDVKLTDLTENILEIDPRRFVLIVFSALLCLELITRVPECCFSGTGTSLLSNPAFLNIKEVLKQKLKSN